jgi:hypothetical protein
MDKNSLIITYDEVNDFVGVIFDDPADDRLDHPGQHEGGMWKVEEFERWYNIETEKHGVVSVFYEPFHSVYHVVTKDGKATAYKDPSEHPCLAALDILAELIIGDELIIKNQLYVDISHRGDGGWLDILDQLAVQVGTTRYKSLDEIPDEVWNNPTYKTFLENHGITKEMKGQI